LCCSARMLAFPRFDAVVALTSPPLVSFLAALFAFLKRERFYCWIMDLNPDEAIAAGWLREKSIAAKALNALLMLSTKVARKIIVLDRFMKQRMLAKGVEEAKIAIVPPWSHDQHAFFSPEGRARCRAEHELTDKFVVMYSGNHSPCHPLDTLLQAAILLAHRPEIRFLFIGGGSEFGKAKAFVKRHALKNVDFLTYQPINKLSETLSSADLHVAVMGNPFVGIVHPCKIYNILTIGTPFLYIGPEESHIEDIIKQLGNCEGVYSARHGDAQSVADHVLRAQSSAGSLEIGACKVVSMRYSKSNLISRMIEALECLPETGKNPELYWGLSDMRTSRMIR